MKKTKYDVVWEENYALLLEFIKKYRRLPKRDEVYKDFYIGQWCANQKKRAKESSFSQERYALLQKAGLFDPSVSTAEFQWEQNFNLLKEFIKKNNQLPKVFEEYRGKAIGAWYATQKHNMKDPDYPAHKLKKMLELGITTVSYSDEWQKHYEELKEYVTIYNAFPKQKDEYNGFKLGLWCTRQKQQAKLPDYPKDRLLLLQEIGLVTEESLKPAGKKYNGKNDELWDEKYELLKKFIAETGKLPSTKEVYKNINIGTWYSHQKRLMKYEDYPVERREKLNALGIYETNNETAWNNNLETLQAFMKEHNRFPGWNEKYDEVNIGSWWYTQKKQLKAGTIRPERLDKLKEYGLINKLAATSDNNTDKSNRDL